MSPWAIVNQNGSPTVAPIPDIRMKASTTTRHGGGGGGGIQQFFSWLLVPFDKRKINASKSWNSCRFPRGRSIFTFSPAPPPPLCIQHTFCHKYVGKHDWKWTLNIMHSFLFVFSQENCIIFFLSFHIHEEQEACLPRLLAENKNKYDHPHFGGVIYYSVDCLAKSLFA